MTMRGIIEIIGFGREGEIDISLITKALFCLRSLIGRIMHWEDADELTKSVTYHSRLSEEDRRHSLIAPSTKLGISRVLYCFEHELLAEIVDRTVHCFWLMAFERTAGGYALYVAIYVRKINWFTPVYMALITPIVNWIVYPSMTKAIRRRWKGIFPLDQGDRSNQGNASRVPSQSFSD